MEPPPGSLGLARHSSQGGAQSHSTQAQALLGVAGRRYFPLLMAVEEDMGSRVLTWSEHVAEKYWLCP